MAYLQNKSPINQGTAAKPSPVKWAWLAALFQGGGAAAGGAAAGTAATAGTAVAGTAAAAGTAATTIGSATAGAAATGAGMLGAGGATGTAAATTAGAGSGIVSSTTAGVTSGGFGTITTPGLASSGATATGVPTASTIPGAPYATATNPTSVVSDKITSVQNFQKSQLTLDKPTSNLPEEVTKVSTGDITSNKPIDLLHDTEWGKRLKKGYKNVQKYMKEHPNTMKNTMYGVQGIQAAKGKKEEVTDPAASFAKMQIGINRQSPITRRTPLKAFGHIKAIFGVDELDSSGKLGNTGGMSPKDAMSGLQKQTVSFPGSSPANNKNIGYKKITPVKNIQTIPSPELKSTKLQNQGLFAKLSSL